MTSDSTDSTGSTIPEPKPTTRSPHAKHWLLDPGTTFLNHGSYGACPIPVLDAQTRYRREMEAEPVVHFLERCEQHLDRARSMWARELAGDETNLAFTTNATAAMSAIIHSIDWQRGDEVLVNDHEYMSVINDLRRLEQRVGIKVVTANIPFPIVSQDQALDAILTKASDNTRLAVVSHVTSPTALVLPIERIVKGLKDRGIETLVDGAHTPAQISINLAAIDPAYFVADLHKWACSPKGTGVLYARADKHDGLRPLALSSRAHEARPDRSLFLKDFDYQGTDDHTPLIASADALEFLASLEPGGLPALMARNHDLIVDARRIVCEAIGSMPACPEDMLGSMAAILLPPRPERLAQASCRFDDPIQDRLVEQHGIQVPIWINSLTGQRALRISAFAYNTLADYEKLAAALVEEIGREQRSSLS